MRRLLSIGLGLALAAGAALSAQMPDLRQMSGQPLPSGDLPAGTISVRVVRQAVTNNVSGVDVELVSAVGAAAAPRKLTTDAAGRAVFPDMPAGAVFRAIVTVDGERLESQPFTVPSSGGLRILLAAGLGGTPGAAPAPSPSEAPALPAAPGSLTLGGQSRIVLELAEESVEVFCLVDIVNPAGRTVTLSSPIVFELPTGAANAAALEGSSPLARVERTKVTVAGPLPAGPTSLQFAYRLPTPTSALRVRQALPLPAPQLTAIVRKLGNLSVTMVGERGRRDVPMEGRSYLVLNTGGLPAGGVMELALEGLPTHARWPRYVALGLAALVVMIGVWAATTGVARPNWEAEDLGAVRAARFDELLALERRVSKRTTPDPSQVARRAELVDQIAELDLALEALRPPSAGRTAGEPSDAVGAGARASAVQ